MTVGLSQSQLSTSFSITLIYLIMSVAVLLFILRYIFDLNIREDIIKLGLCFGVARKCTGGGDEPIRYNIVKRRKRLETMAMELATEHAEEQLEQDKFNREQEEVRQRAQMARRKDQYYYEEEEEYEEEEDEEEDTHNSINN